MKNHIRLVFIAIMALPAVYNGSGAGAGSRHLQSQVRDVPCRRWQRRYSGRQSDEDPFVQFTRTAEDVRRRFHRGYQEWKR